LLFRLFIFGLMAFAVFIGVTAARDRKKLLRARPNVKALAGSAPRLVEALGVRDELLEVFDRHAGAGAVLEAKNNQAQLDQVIEQLADQIDLGRRIAAALEEFDGEAHDARVAAAQRELEEAQDEDAQSAAGRTLESLSDQAERVDRLTKRLSILEATADQTVVELRNLQLALLDALSTNAGVGALSEAQRQLGAAQERLQHQAAADAEVGRLLSSS